MLDKKILPRISVSRAHTAERVTLGTKDGLPYIFTAVCIGGDMPKGDVQALELEGDRASLNGAHFGRLDPTYKPRTNKNFVRYTGFQGFSDDYTTTLLVEKRLLRGAPTGLMKIQGTGETFFTATYRCTREG